MTFAEWYALYPRKKERKEAEKAWRSLSASDRKNAMTALPNHIAEWEAKGTEKDFIPYPASWLRGARWEDEIEMPTAPKQVVAWWASDEGVQQKAASMGISARPGEDWTAFKARVVEAVRRAA